MRLKQNFCFLSLSYTKIFAIAVSNLVISVALAAPAAKPIEKPTNPLLTNWWKGPYGGIPPFDKITVADFKPALEEAIKMQLAEVEAIANSPAPPTFENTVAALDYSGQTMNRVQEIYLLWQVSMNDSKFQEVAKEMAPKLAGLQDDIFHNEKLFKRIDSVFNSPKKSKLTGEQQRLTWFHETNFILHGARLTEKQKARVSEINQRLATLSTQFSQNELADEENESLTIDKKTDLAGLPQSEIDGAATEATRRKQNGKWVFANTRSAMEPFLTYSENRPLREKAFRMWTSRGDNDNSHNNNKVVTEILSLRSERSKILGFPSYAHWHLDNRMAKNPDTAMDLMMQVWKPALARVKSEVIDMQAIVDADKGNFKIQPWDYRFYAEKVRKAKYDLDLNAVKPFLRLEKVREAMFWMAKQLYGFNFKKLEGVPVYHEDMSVYEVFGANGKQVGLWYFDPYARPGKDSGAWMNNYREQQKIKGQAILPIVSNNANFIKGKPGEPVTISWDDAVTMFHEFGHALHSLNSNVTYPSLSGTNTSGDFVEFPSQFHENYLKTPEILKFLTDQDGKSFPKELVVKIENSKYFNQGFSTLEFLASAIVDMKLHLAQGPIDPHAFEKASLAELQMPSEIVMRHRIPQFGHLFATEDYAAGYYGYLWAQVLDEDAFAAFVEAGGPYDKKMAKLFHDNIMSVGNTVDPAVTYRKFRGRDPKVDALLKARNFPLPESKVQ